MGTYLSQITKKPAAKPPRIVVHGRGGVGKTSLLASVPDVLVIPAEDGLGLHQVPHLPKPGSYVELMNALSELYNEEHPYRAVGIDTIDKIEPLVWAHTCEQASVGNKKQYKNIEDFGYQKGYLYADPYWIDLYRMLDALREKGMTIVVLCHNETKTVEDPNIGAYDRVAPKLHKRANALLYEWADICGFLDIERTAFTHENEKKRKVATSQVLGNRILYLEDQGGFEAKNRYNLPPQIALPKENPYGALREALLKSWGIAPKTTEAA